MALMRTFQNRGIFCIAVTFGKNLYIGHRPLDNSKHLELVSSEVEKLSFKLLSNFQSPLRLLEFSTLGHHLVTCGDDKRTVVFNVDDWKIVGERIVPKRPTSFQFSDNDQSLLVADKSGEVTRYSVPTLESTKSLLLGHSSMLLDMKLVAHQETDKSLFLITCDRDEKIRVSHYPNGYNIHTYCLGHNDFVSKLCCIEQFPHLLLSGGGDGQVCVWNWYKGQLLHTLLLDKLSSNNKEDPSVVIFINCITTWESHSIIAIATERSTNIFIYKLDSSGILALCEDIQLNFVPWCLEVDPMNRLWVCLPDEKNPVKCFKWTGNEMKQISHNEEPLLIHIDNWQYAKDCVGLETDWSELKKHDFDNISAYLIKKQERVQSKRFKDENPAVVRSVMVSEIVEERDLEKERHREFDNPKLPKVMKIDKTESES